MGRHNNLLIGISFAVLATALWSGNFVVARDLSNTIHPVSLSFYRWFVAVVAFTPFAVKHLIRDWDSIKKHISYLFLTAILGVSLFNTLIYFAGHSTEAVNMSLIMLTFPIFIMLISSIAFHEKINHNKILGIFIVLLGVIGIITRGNYLSILNIKFNAGDPLMLSAAFVFAIHSNLVKRKPKNISVFSLQYSTFLLGLIVLFPFHILLGSKLDYSLVETSTITQLIYIGICSSIISFVSWNKAIEKIGAVSAGMIYYLLPLFSGLAAWMFLDEKLRLYHLISGVFIISGILISNHKIKSKTITHPIK
jgi:drug/metabolite transporter (DMT)-like permease